MPIVKKKQVRKNLDEAKMDEVEGIKRGNRGRVAKKKAKVKRAKVKAKVKARNDRRKKVVKKKVSKKKAAPRRGR